MKNLYTFGFALALTGLGLTAQAQNEFYVDGSGGASEVYVDNEDGTNPTLYVQGEVIVDGTDGLLQNQNNGYIRVEDGANPGDITASNSSTLDLNSGTETELTGDFTLASNAVVAAGNTSILEFNGTGTQGFDVSGQGTQANYDLGNVYVNTPLIDITGGEMAINNELHFDQDGGGDNSVIRTNANRVNMLQASSFNNHYMTAGGAGAFTQRYINGNLRWQLTTATSYDLPVGDGASAQPAVMSFASNPSASATYIDAFFDPGVPGYSGGDLCGVDVSTSPINGYTGNWNLSSDLGGLGTATPSAMSLDLRPHDYATPGAVADVVMLIDNGNTSYTAQGSGDYDVLVQNPATDVLANCVDAGTVNNPSSAGNNINNFGSFGGGITTIDPLPVEGLNLTATAREPSKDIYLDWITLQENNSSHFDLERSTDAQNFSAIQTNIPAAGNSNVPKQYSFTDANVEFNTTYYYRIQQFDNDGSATYSNIAEAILRNTENGVVQATFFPNPANNGLNLQVNLQEAGTMNLTFYDAVGKNIYNKNFDLESGPSTLDLTGFLNEVAYGQYNAVITVNGEVITNKLVKTR